MVGGTLRAASEAGRKQFTPRVLPTEQARLLTSFTYYRHCAHTTQCARIIVVLIVLSRMLLASTRYSLLVAHYSLLTAHERTLRGMVR